MKKTLLIIGRSIRIVAYSAVFIVFLYILFAFVLSVIPVNSWQETDEPKTETVYLLTNGVHLDFVFKSEDLQAFQIDFEIEKKHEYIAIGWGDKGFYLNTATWSDLKFKTAFNAMFLKSETAIHLTRYQNLNSKAVELKLTKGQLETIINYCISSFEKSSDENFIKIPDAAYFNNDSFYEAKGSYNCIKTCNEWINLGLKKAKVKTALWSPFDKGILYQIDE